MQERNLVRKHGPVAPNLQTRELILQNTASSMDFESSIDPKSESSFSTVLPNIYAFESEEPKKITKPEEDTPSDEESVAKVDLANEY